ncbi:hypothetical protein [Ancylomarina sp.]|uniref:hypothetical protein n=1 Tax=Ancylomarina sp. TaxID=1970196 RepID=UPI0035670FA2
MNFKRKNNDINLDQLVGKLQKEDKTYGKLFKLLKIIYWIYIPIYILLAIGIFLITKEIDDLFAGFCFIISFIIFALILGNYQKDFKNADYALPTLLMLKNAANRYKPFQLKGLWVILAIIFMDAGFSINSFAKNHIITIQIIFLGIMLISILVGIIIWFIKHKPLRDNALRLVAEIEGE